MKPLLTVLLFSLLFASNVVADEHHHEHEDFGNVTFSTSCTASAQQQFNRAVSILHSFGYEEAANAFLDVAKTDPDCAMAYWGLAMTCYHPIWAPPGPAELQKGSEAIQKAKITGHPTAREKAYIDALNIFFTDAAKVDHATRAKNYANAMGGIAKQYPEDHEARIFYALALRGTAPPNDKSYTVQKQAAQILLEELKKQPNHPGIAHYLIHSYDYPALAELALPAARIYSKLAPSSPHALHMPSHIFTRLGLWQESIDSNRASKASAIERVQKLHPGAGAFDQLHAMDYLMYAYLQTGQDDQAKKIIDEANSIQKLDQEQFAAAYALAAIPVRYRIERNDWKEATHLQVAPAWFPWKQFPYAEAITHYARGLGAARSGNLNVAKEAAGKLEELHKAMADLKDPYWTQQIEIQQKVLDAWIAFAERTGEALQKMKVAADLEDSTDKHAVTPGVVIPARELLADMLMEMNRPTEALPEYEKSLQVAPNRFHALYGTAKAARASGDKEKAKKYFGLLRKQCVEPCSRPEFLEAKKFLAGI